MMTCLCAKLLVGVSAKMGGNANKRLVTLAPINGPEIFSVELCGCSSFV